MSQAFVHSRYTLRAQHLIIHGKIRPETKEALNKLQFGITLSGGKLIETIEEAQRHARQWLWTYNNERPNMGIGGITPAQKLKMAA